MPNCKNLNPWEQRPFELIYHAEVHYRKGSDYDRRLALISFDNAIECSITTYLTLHPSQRGDRQYPQKDVKTWLHNYHSKLDFLLLEAEKREITLSWSKPAIVWYHHQRNDQYHGSGDNVPKKDTLDEIRQIALRVFSLLFEITDIEFKLNETVLENDPNTPKIPGEYIVPIESKADGVAASAEELNTLAAATLIGGWDENNDDDMDIVKGIADGF